MSRPWDPPLTLNGWLRWEVASGLLPPHASDVLEIGCGQGAFGARLADRYRYVGVEPDPLSFAVAEARIRMRDGDVRLGDVDEIGAAEEFDLVCAFEVLEHIDDDSSALERWVHHVRPRGTLIVSVPAWSHRYSHADLMVGHVRRYDPHQLFGRLQEVGLVDCTVIQFGGPAGFVLEAARNAFARRQRARTQTLSREELTAASGRLLQSPSGVGAASVFVLMYPLRKLQAVFPNSGPGLIGLGRQPARSRTG